jgi:5-formyltetrahydrofolate cyclo-ligase
MKMEQASAQPSIPEQKSVLRHTLLQKRSGCAPQVQKRQNEKLNRRLCQLWQFREAETVLGYYPIGSAERGFEPDIRPALLEALARGKRVALPRGTPDGTAKRKREMDFFLVESLDGLRPGSFGVPEPDPARHERLPRPESGLCLVPALAFDGSGHRLGYGKGYYDRFLSRFVGSSLGICYGDFLLERLPRGFFDRPVDAVLTQHTILFTKESSKHNG